MPIMSPRLGPNQFAPAEVENTKKKKRLHFGITPPPKAPEDVEFESPEESLSRSQGETELKASEQAQRELRKKPNFGFKRGRRR